MATEGRTFLHMVYAGRGDAFLIEYNDSTSGQRRLIQLDGGPEHTTARSTGDTPKAPYYKYLFSAVKEIWHRMHGRVTPMPPFAPEAIFISHAHEDHYGGILQILKSSLPANYNAVAQPNDKMFFNGPIVLPFMADSKGCEELHEYLIGKGFTYNSNAILEPLPKSVDLLYPLPIIRRYDRIPQLPLGRTFGADGSTDNVISLLMTHRVVDDVGQNVSKMFFTGDSVGHIISPVVATQGTALNPLSIYKIQHHGSMRNTQFGNAKAGVKLDVIAEAQLRAVLFWKLSSSDNYRYIPSGIRHLVTTIHLDSIYNAFEYYTVLNNLHLQSVLDQLLARELYYLGLCKKVDTFSIESPDQTYSEIWKDFVASLEESKDEVFWRKIVKPTRSPPSYYPRDWWKLYVWRSPWADRYLSILTTFRVERFFASFYAQAYVLSANGKYKHPAAETIVGLALSLLQKNQAASLFVTSAWSVDLSALGVLCQAANVSLSTLIKPGTLTICYLRTGIYMTLDASVKQPATADLGGKTEAIPSISLGNPPTYDTLNDALERDMSPLPTRTVGIDTYVISCQINGVEYFLNLTAGGTPLLATISPGNRFSILEAWQIDAHTTNEIEVTLNVAGDLRTCHFRVQRDLHERDHWQLIWKDEMDTWTTFFLSPPNAPIKGPADPPPSNLKPLMSFTFTRITMASVTLGVSAFELPQPLLDSSLSLRDFCIAAKVPLASNCNGTDALIAVLGEENYISLGVTKTIQDSWLVYQVDVATSSVQYTEDGTTLQPTAATILLEPPSGTSITFNGEDFTIATVSASMEWNEDLSVVFSMKSIVEQGLVTTLTKKVSQAGHISSLSQYLSAAGFTSSSVSTVTVIKLLTFLTMNPSTTLEKISRIPTSIMSQGLMMWLPDTTRSSVEATRTVTGDLVVIKARLVCNISALSATMVGITLAIDELVLTVTDGGLPSETLILSGSASISQAPGGPKASLAMFMSLDDAETSLTCTLGASASLETLEMLLPRGTELTGANIPFESESISTLTTSSVGFVITQPVTASPSYTITSVFAATSFSDWEAYLPAGFPSPLAPSVRVRLEILYPFVEESRAVRALIDFAAQIDATPTPKTIKVTFQAEPLAVPEDYEYRVHVSTGDPDLPPSLRELLFGVKMDNVVSDVLAAVPFIGTILDTVSINEVSAAVAQAGSPTVWKFQDFSLDLNISTWNIVPGLLNLSGARIRLESCNGYWQFWANGRFSIVNVGDLDVEFQIPSPSFPGSKHQGSPQLGLMANTGIGFFKIDNPDGVSATQFLSTVGLPDFSSVPVIGGLLNTTVNKANVTVGYHPTTNGSQNTDLGILGGQISLSWDNLTIGPLALGSVEVDLIYHSAVDPLGLQKDQTIFNASSFLSQLPIEVSIGYDSLAKVSHGSFRPLQPTTVAATLEALLHSSIANSLLPLIGSLNIESVDISFGVPDFAIKTFSVILDRTATTEIDNGTVTVGLKSLRVDYAAAVLPTDVTPGIPTTYVLFGQTIGTNAQGDVLISCIKDMQGVPSGTENTTVTASISPTLGGHLTLTGILSLFGITIPTFSKPEGSPEFFDLEIKQVSAELSLSDSQGSNLQVNQMSFIVQSVGTLSILDSPPITLHDIRLQLGYSRDGSITAAVSGSLAVSTATLWVAYQKDNLVESYAGTLAFADPQEEVDFITIAAQFLPADTYTLPPNLNVPTHLPSVSISCAITPKKSFEIWCNASGTLWSFTAAGVSTSLTNVAGNLKITDDANGSPTYEAYIHGELTFSTFTTLEASLRLGTSVPLLTAVIHPSSPSDTNQIELLSEELSDNGRTWASLLPVSTTQIRFASFAYLYIDFNASKFAIFGAIEGLGDAVLLGRPSYTTAGRGFLFSITVTEVGQLWPSLTAALDSVFNFNIVSVEIMGLDGTVKQLKDDLHVIEAVALEDGVVLSDHAAAITLPETDQILPGVTLYALIGINGSSSLSKMLGISANPVSSPTITLSAFIPKSDPSTAMFSIQVADFTMFGGAIIINGSGTYASGTKTIAIDATLDLILGQNSITEFKVKVDVNVSKTSFDVDATASLPVIDQPFDHMFGISFKHASISGTISTQDNVTTRVYRVTGSVHLGTTPGGVDLTGSILFIDSVPTIAKITLDTDLSVLLIFASIISGGSSDSASWPTAYDPIIFKQGGMIYYSKSSTPVILDGSNYLSGYHISSRISIFSLDWVITATLPDTKKGILLVGNYLGGIDLVFVKLVGSTVDPNVTEPGPAITVDTTDSSNIVYGLSFGMTLFDTPGFNVSLQYETQDKSYTGTAGFTGEFLGLSNPSIHLKYIDGKIDITDLPMLKDMKDLLNIADAISEAAAASPGDCGPLAGMIFEEVITTKFTLSMSNTRMLKSDLLADIQGEYDIGIANKVNITQVHMPDLTVTIAGPFTQDRILSVIGDSILASLASIGESLFQQPEALASIIAAISVENFAKQVVIGLLCRRVNTPNLARRANELEAEEWDDIFKSNNEGEKAEGSASEAEGANSITAAGDALTTAVSALGAFAALVDALSDFIDKLISWGLGTDDQKQKRDEAEANRQRAETAVAAAHLALAKALVLSGTPTSQFQPDESLLISWEQVKPRKNNFDYKGYANFTWQVRYGPTNNFGQTTLVTTPSTSITLPAADFLEISTVYIWIDAIYTHSNSLKVESEHWTPAQTATHVLRLPSLPPISLSFEAGVGYMFSAPTLPTGQYNLTIIDAANPSNILQTRDLAVSTPAPIRARLTLPSIVPSQPVLGIQAKAYAISSDPKWANSDVAVSEVLSLSMASTFAVLQEIRLEIPIPASDNVPTAFSFVPDAQGSVTFVDIPPIDKTAPTAAYWTVENQALGLYLMLNGGYMSTRTIVKDWKGGTQSMTLVPNIADAVPMTVVRDGSGAVVLIARDGTGRVLTVDTRGGELSFETFHLGFNAAPALQYFNYLPLGVE